MEIIFNMTKIIFTISKSLQTKHAPTLNHSKLIYFNYLIFNQKHRKKLF